MSFKPNFLEEIGINADTVPQGLVVAFTDVNQTNLRIQSPEGENKVIDTRTIQGYQTLGDVKETIRNTLIEFGAKPAELRV